ncbi:hypothetical protein N9I30_00145 [Flavobacteriales bacterium]|mgnify:FL=1|jgi:hypothetical protein|nr:hypothetical protein [Flavobacteriales bacterium]
MKKLLLVFITLTTLTNVSYSSFPITENNTVLTDQNLFILVPNDEEQEEPSWMVFIYILNAIILIIGFYFLLRTIWRAWGKRKWWVRKLLPLLLLISLPTFLSALGILISIPLLLLLGLIMLIRKLMGKTILW